MRQKFPANFSDLLFLGLIGWLVKDWGILMDNFFQGNEIASSVLFLGYIYMKLFLALAIILIRTLYNHGK